MYLNQFTQMIKRREREIFNKQYPAVGIILCFVRENDLKSPETKHPIYEASTQKRKRYKLKIDITQATLLAQGQTGLLSVVEDERGELCNPDVNCHCGCDKPKDHGAKLCDAQPPCFSRVMHSWHSHRQFHPKLAAFSLPHCRIFKTSKVKPLFSCYFMAAQCTLITAKVGKTVIPPSCTKWFFFHSCP